MQHGMMRVAFRRRGRLRSHVRRPRLRKAADGKALDISRDVRRETCQELQEYAAWDDARYIPQA